MNTKTCGPETKNGQVVVRARCKWNDTGFEVVGGAHYRLSVNGTWFDAHYEKDAAGYRSDDPVVPRFSRPMFALAERWRRLPGANWFSLIGAVDRKSLFDMGAVLHSGSGEFTAPASGRLFCFANDLPFMYWNNKGQVLIQIERVDSMPFNSEKN